MALSSWVAGADGSGFPAEHLPFGVFSTPGTPPRAGVRIGVDPMGGSSVDYWAEIADVYGLDLEIYAEGEKIGTLIIGRGSLFWRGGKRKGQKQIDWTRFAQIMDQLAYDT